MSFGSGAPGGFSFGAATPAQSGGLFGAKPATPQPAGMFGAQPAANAAPAGFGFAQAAPASTPGLFGAPTSTPSLFGTATSTPAGFGFQSPAQTAALPAFGAKPGTGLTFGTPASTATGFGTIASTAPATGLFGSPAASAAPATGLFGAPAASTAPTTGMFGAPAASTAPTTGMFGAPAASTTQATGLFGATAASTTPATGLFGASSANTAPATGLFGTPATSTLGTSTLGAPTLGTPATSGFTLGGGLGAATTAPTFNFSSTATPSTGGFTLGSTLGATSTPSTGLFGLSTSTTPSVGLNLTTSTTGTFPAISAPASGLGGIALKPQETLAPVGLGGIVSSQGQKQANKGGSETAPKDQPLPNEIMQSVEEFKKYVKQQKTFCSEICRFSAKEFKKVEEEIDMAQGMITDVEKQLQVNRQVAEKLKYDTARALQNVEMAQRTLDTPPGLQFDNTAPLQFFVELTDGFEKEMQFLKLQIESTDKYLHSVGKPEGLTPEDLALGMRRLHETFVALAGRLQSVHNQVEQQKQMYLNFRQTNYHDHSNVFDKVPPVSDKMNVVITTMDYKPPLVVTGPTPFDPVTNPHVAAHNMQASQPSLPGTTSAVIQSTAAPFSFSQSSAPTSNLFGTTPTFGTNPNPLSSSFQLQKPPAVGSKRSK